MPILNTEAVRGYYRVTVVLDHPDMDPVIDAWCCTFTDALRLFAVSAHLYQDAELTRPDHIGPGSEDGLSDLERDHVAKLPHGVASLHILP